MNALPLLLSFLKITSNSASQLLCYKLLYFYKGSSSSFNLFNETKLEQNIITDQIIRKTYRVTDHSSLLRIDISGTLTKLRMSRGSL